MQIKNSCGVKVGRKIETKGGDLFSSEITSLKDNQRYYKTFKYQNLRFDITTILNQIYIQSKYVQILKK